MFNLHSVRLDEQNSGPVHSRIYCTNHSSTTRMEKSNKTLQREANTHVANTSRNISSSWTYSSILLLICCSMVPLICYSIVPLNCYSIVLLIWNIWQKDHSAEKWGKEKWAKTKPRLCDDGPNDIFVLIKKSWRSCSVCNGNVNANC